MTPDEPHPVDGLVRVHLDREAAKVDAHAMLARVKQPPVQPRHGWRWVGVALGAALAAGLAFLFIMGNGPEPTPLAASPDELLRESRITHEAATDRCYAVVAEWEPIPLRVLKLEPLVRTSKLWTRGDQFWIETTDPQGRSIAWGQTKDGKVWVAPSRAVGLVYDEADVGEPLARYCELMSLRVVTTLGELLADYDLYRRDAGQPGEPIRIEASRRPVQGLVQKFGHVALELDPETKVIQKAVLSRRVNGETVGTLTFTLTETAKLADDQYTVAGHLDAKHTLHDGKLKRPDPRIKLRDEVLKRLRKQ